MGELREILRKFSFATIDDVTISGKVMSGKAWKKDISKVEKEVKKYALGLFAGFSDSVTVTLGEVRQIIEKA